MTDSSTFENADDCIVGIEETLKAAKRAEIFDFFIEKFDLRAEENTGCLNRMYYGSNYDNFK